MLSVKFNRSVMSNLYAWIPIVLLLFFRPAIMVAQQSAHTDSNTIQPILSPQEVWDIDTLSQPIPVNRAYFTDKVYAEIQKLDARDGQINHYIHYLDSNQSEQISTAVFNIAPQIIVYIENLAIEHSQKVKYLHGLELILRDFRLRNWVKTRAGYFSSVLLLYKQFIRAESQHEVLAFAQKEASLPLFQHIEWLDAYPDAKAVVYKKMSKQYPEMMIQRLPDYAEQPYADPVIAAAAKSQPGLILNYAMSTSKMRNAVRRNTDPLVKTIVRIADESEQPLKALPFLDAIHSGEQSVEEVDAFTHDDVAYYKNLVALQLKHKQLASKALDQEIQYRALKFVRMINELHDSPDGIRFRAIEPFNAEELYFLMIGGQDEIYTSSFTNGTFRKMMAKMKPMKGNEFMEKIHKSHFRTFIRMCAGFNTLQTFLSTFDQDEKYAMLSEFVAQLEEGGADDLEDAVDVADAFGSINDPELLEFLRKEIQHNYDRLQAIGERPNAKGTAVYGLLQAIFNPDKNPSGNLPIPPITYVPYEDLTDGENGVVEQVFFYGDRSGMGTYHNFLNQYRNGKWKIASTPYWTTITSTGAHKVTIYMNIPLPEEQGEDDEAQRLLREYMDEHNINPTIIVHRGHSYYLNTTIAYMVPSVKVVMLGSCGGYHNLAQVLDRAPDAHIISSKQVGALRVNVPIINQINDYAWSGQDMDWIKMWKDLSRRFSGSGAYTRDLFSDYVPPNKNLGVIFIKAYRAIMADELAE